nr:zinc ribbon domain-containing protein [Okeania sp. SIO3B5]
MVVDRFYPSTKTCSSCGYVQDMPLNLRTYDCPNCGASIYRAC